MRQKSKKIDFKISKNITTDNLIDWKDIQDKEIELKFSLKPKNTKQEKYINAILTSNLILSFGPAGVGRTYVACGAAVRLLQEKKVSKIILTRPTIECGSSMGHLPGSAIEKAISYMYPMMDALEEFLGEKQLNYLISKDVIRIAPLAQMRGSSFKNCILIADEMQNATMTELRMILTRIGTNCTMVISGDCSQSDLKNKNSDLLEIINKLKILPEVSIIKFEKEDIVRSGLVRKIIEILN